MAKDFNFSRTPFENERLPRLVFATAAALVLGVTLVHGFFLARYLVREQEALDIKVEELREELTATDAAIARTEANLAQQQTALSNDQTEFLTRIYRHKSFSWTGLFNELEEITPAAVRITSIAPFEENGEIAVTLSLVGRTLTNVLEMVSALEGSRFFATVFPLDEVDLAEIGDGRETGIAATLRLRYIAPPSAENDGEADVAVDAPLAEDDDVEDVDDQEDLDDMEDMVEDPDDDDAPPEDDADEDDSEPMDAPPGAPRPKS